MITGMHHLVGAAEIGKLFGGISRQRVQQIVSRPDFPAPVADLAMGKVWESADVVRWARNHGRTVEDAPEA